MGNFRFHFSKKIEATLKSFRYIYNIHGFSIHLNDTINSICIVGSEIESTNNCFLRCLDFSEARQSLFGDIQSINKILLSQNKSSLTRLLF